MQKRAMREIREAICGEIVKMKGHWKAHIETYCIEVS